MEDVKMLKVCFFLFKYYNFWPMNVKKYNRKYNLKQKQEQQELLSTTCIQAF